MNTQSNRISVRNMEKCIYNPKEKKFQDIKTVDAEIPQTMVFTLYGKHEGLYNLRGQLDEQRGYPVIFDKERIRKDDHKEIQKASNFEHAYAQQIRYRNTLKYFLRKGHQGRFFNPLSAAEEIRYNKTYRGKENNEYIEVEPKVFMLYINFLKSKNVAYLKNAERYMV